METKPTFAAEYSQDAFTAYALQTFQFETGIQVQRTIAIAAAFYMADTSDEEKAILKLYRAALTKVGRSKGGVSTLVKQAKIVGKSFAGLFGKEIATPYANEMVFVKACFQAAIAADANVIDRLMSWAEHGDAKTVSRMVEKKKKAAEEAEVEVEADENFKALLSMDLEARDDVTKPAPNPVFPRATLADIVERLIAEHGVSALRAEIAEQIKLAKAS